MADMGAKLQDVATAVTAGRRAFVAGATGYTGRELVAELRRLDVHTVAHVRPDSSRLDEWRDRFGRLGAVVDAAAWEPQEVRASLERHRPHVVFALLGTTRARGRAAGAAADETYERVDYGLTALLLRAAIAAAPDARFVYLSSMGVGPRARGAYLQARWRLEQELRASPLDWTIVRPAFITGPDREESRPVERGSAMLIDGLLGAAALVGGRRLRDRFASLTAAQLARGLARHAFDAGSSRREITPEELRA